MALTRRQKQVLDFIVSFINRHRYSPSFEEIAEGLNLTSLATVHKHLQTLEKKGFIRRGYNQSRSLEVMQLPRPVKEDVARQVFELPLMGRIAAGRPVEAVENPETISLAEFTRSRNVFVLEVKGDSMIEDHIVDGDFIIVEQTENANNRDIVVALVGGQESTLKRFFREPGGKVRLQPANPSLPPIVVAAKDVQIQGRVVGILRRY
ncbi:MAG: transcriptional repressor LexA [Candidatus Acidiferrales bacterium]